MSSAVGEGGREKNFSRRISPRSPCKSLTPSIFFPHPFFPSFPPRETKKSQEVIERGNVALHLYIPLSKGQIYCMKEFRSNLFALLLHSCRLLARVRQVSCTPSFLSLPKKGFCFCEGVREKKKPAPSFGFAFLRASYGSQIEPI